MAVTASNCSDLALPKPEPRRKAKARAKRQEAAWRADVRRQVKARANGRCEKCGKSLPTIFPEDHGEMHEIISRAKTRGMSPERRFSLENCVFWCATCHRGPKGAHK